MILDKNGAIIPDRPCLVLDLQFGSTGKGLIAGKLAESGFFTAAVTSWGPNAGHTYIDSKNRKFVHTMLANSAPWVQEVFIGPGSYVNIESLVEEYEQMHLATNKLPTVWIHPHAAIVNPEHRQSEAAFVKIGSTMKGTAAAAIQRMMRDPDAPNVAVFESCFHTAEGAREVLKGYPISVCRTPLEYADLISAHLKSIIFEGAQGFGLSMYHGFYPYTTSRDVSTMQILADSGVPLMGLADMDVIGTARTYPIRVANRFGPDGEMIGTSGPCWHDQREIKWTDLGLTPELTTVTKLPRRIFTFSREQFNLARRYNAPAYLFLNFCNYLTLSGNKIDPLMPSMREAVYYFISQQMGLDPADLAPALIIGTGPTYHDVAPFESLPRAPFLHGEWK